MSVYLCVDAGVSNRSGMYKGISVFRQRCESVDDWKMQK